MSGLDLFAFPFAYPWVLAAPIVALLVRLAAPTRRAAACVFPDGAALGAIPPSWRVRLRGPVLGALLFFAILAATIAAARPQRVTVLHGSQERRSLMLALDISRSMATTDFEGTFGHGRVSRIEAVKAVVRRFAAERREERLGLIVFGSGAYVQAPLTRDHAVVEELVSRLQVGMAGDGTAMGDGLGLALKRIDDIPAASKAVILLTDGVSNSGQVNPLKAAEVAKELGVKVYTIGIGGRENLIQRDAGGTIVGRGASTAEFDEATLQRIAEVTGGRYLNASTVEGLQEVYAEIDRLERTRTDDPEHRIIDELFPPFAFAALIFFASWAILRATVFRSLP